MTGESTSCAASRAHGACTRFPELGRYLGPYSALEDSCADSSALTALAAFSLAAPAGADAAVRHVLKGAGFGHGIGMSQYGAYGYALEGSGYKGILDHYYKGTRLESAPSRPVRVLLQPSDPYIRFRGATSAGGEALRKATTYVARRSGSASWLSTSGDGESAAPPVR